MILDRHQITKLKKAWITAQNAEKKMRVSAKKLADIISAETQVEGHVDYLPGDGFGFTPLSNGDTHVYIGDLIDMAEQGVDITEDVILESTTL